MIYLLNSVSFPLYILIHGRCHGYTRTTMERFEKGLPVAAPTEL